MAQPEDSVNRPVQSNSDFGDLLAAFGINDITSRRKKLNSAGSRMSLPNGAAELALSKLESVVSKLSAKATHDMTKEAIPDSGSHPSTPGTTPPASDSQEDTERMGGGPVIISTVGSTPMCSEESDITSSSANQCQDVVELPANVIRTAPLPIPSTDLITKLPTSVAAVATLPVVKVSDKIEPLNTLLLEKNPIATYIAPDPPDYLRGAFPFPGQKFRCLACGDTFFFETSLENHLSRDSINISLDCSFCPKKLMFHNKCSLHYHKFEHYSKQEVVDISSAVVTPLSRFLMPKFSKDQISTKTSVEKLKFMCSECKHLCADRAGLEEHFEHLGRGSSYACVNCEQQSPNNCHLTAHRRIHIQQKVFTCPECGMIEFGDFAQFKRHLLNVCYHFSRICGFRCPTCTINFTKIHLLKTHLQNTHTDRFFKCTECPMAFKSFNNFVSHISTTHQKNASSSSFNMIYKCPLCNTVFTQQQMLVNHFDSHLSDAPLKGTTQKHYFFKCLICSKVFERRSDLATHVWLTHKDVVITDLCDICFQNFDSPEALSAHRELHCSHCAMHFGSYTSLQKHLTVAHLITLNPSHPACCVCLETFLNAGALSQHLMHHERYGILVCHRCNVKFSKITDRDAHRIKQHSGSGDSAAKDQIHCPECPSKFTSRGGFMKHMKMMHRKIERVVCSMCQRSFECYSSLKRHIQINHKGLQRIYRCWMCPDHKYNRRGRLEQHLRRDHDISDEKIDFSKMAEPKTYSPELAQIMAAKNGDRSSSPVDIDVPNSPRQRPLKSKRRGEDSVVTSTDEKQPRNDSQPEVTIAAQMCSKCGLKFEDRDLYQAHIKQHKERSSVPCPECASCFVSTSALRKHLFIVHKIKNPTLPDLPDETVELSPVIRPSVDPQVSATGRDDTADSANKTTSKSNTIEWECKVCYRLFSGETELRTHMRTHGMAFIKSKRLSDPASTLTVNGSS